MKRFFRRGFIPFIFLAAMAVTQTAYPDAVIQSAHQIVISGHPEATKLGLQILDNGGNAIDAFVTTSLALGFAEPGNSGLGGKLDLMYYDAATGETFNLLGMDASIQKLDVDAFQKLPAEQHSRTFHGACVPALAGVLEAAHQKWGSQPWASLVTPAADLADRGFVLTPLMAKMDSQFPPQFQKEAAAIFAPNGKLLEAGQTFRNPDLANTYRIVAEQGARAIYGGPIGEKLVAAFNAGGVPMTMDDLTSLKPRFLNPVTGEYHGLTFYSSAPPASGGCMLVASLECLDKLGLPAADAPRDADYINRVCRVWQQVMPSVSTTAGDVPDSDDRVAKLLAGGHIAALAKRAMEGTPDAPAHLPSATSKAATEPSRETLDWPSGGVNIGGNDDSPLGSTTHVIIVDAKGDIVCATQSLGLHFGSGVLAPGTGFLLNSDMDNFGITGVNGIGPGKWPRSTITPTIVLKDGKPFMAIGSPAAARIPTGVLQVTLDVVDYHRPLEEAIRAPRFHLPRSGGNGIDCETGFDPKVLEKLADMGWAPHARSDDDFYFGSVNAVMWLGPHALTGVADTRRTYDASGD